MGNGVEYIRQSTGGGGSSASSDFRTCVESDESGIVPRTNVLGRGRGWGGGIPEE